MHFALTKELANANEAFDALTEGTIQANRAANFNDIMAPETITDAACWAHLIRKIKEAVAAHLHFIIQVKQERFPHDQGA